MTSGHKLQWQVDTSSCREGLTSSTAKSPSWIKENFLANLQNATEVTMHEEKAGVLVDIENLDKEAEIVWF